MNQFPVISIVIPVYNEELELPRCLESIYTQNYPKEKLDVIVVDNESTDKTLEIARAFKTRIYTSDIKDAQVLKMIGFKKSKGEYFIFLDADNRLIGTDWFEKMLLPHTDESCVGSVCDIIPDPMDPPLSQFFASYSFYSSPLFSFFSTKIESVIVQKSEAYDICEYRIKSIPPTGSCLYKMKFLIRAHISNQPKFMELDVLHFLVEKGLSRFAYVKYTRMYHSHISHIQEIFWKRKRNLERNYLKDINQRRFTWIDFSSTQSKIKGLVWLLYVFTFFGPVLRGLQKSFRYRSLWYIVYEVAVPFVETIAVALGIFQSPYRYVFLKKILQKQ